MEESFHSINSLFAQLGVPSDDAAISHFIAVHGPLPSTIKIHDAAFWSPTQAHFLQEAILDDADWADVVEAQNVELHAHTAHT